MPLLATRLFTLLSAVILCALAGASTLTVCPKGCDFSLPSQAVAKADPNDIILVRQSIFSFSSTLIYHFIQLLWQKYSLCRCLHISSLRPSYPYLSFLLNPYFRYMGRTPTQTASTRGCPLSPSHPAMGLAPS